MKPNKADRKADAAALFDRLDDSLREIAACIEELRVAGADMEAIDAVWRRLHSPGVVTEPLDVPPLMLELKTAMDDAIERKLP